MTTSLMAILDEQLAAAEQAVMVSTGGAAWCQLQRDGRITGGVKYDEGRLAALMAIRRRWRTSDPAAWEQLLVDELQQWQQGLADVQKQPKPALPWLAYRQGGVDALTMLHEAVQNTLIRPE